MKDNNRTSQGCANESNEIIKAPFLVKKRKSIEKEKMRQKYKKLQQQNNKQKNVSLLETIHHHLLTSHLLENKASTARDHMANERTFLAWLRAALSMITVGVGK
jgi:hypothetical protein